MFCGRFRCEHVFWESFSPNMIYYKLGEWDLAVLPMVQQAAMGRFMDDWYARHGIKWETSPGLDLCQRQISKKVEIQRCVCFCLNPFCFSILKFPWKHEKKHVAPFWPTVCVCFRIRGINGFWNLRKYMLDNDLLSNVQNVIQPLMIEVRLHGWWRIQWILAMNDCFFYILFFVTEPPKQQVSCRNVC